MKTREEALSYGLSFPDTYQESPFHDNNWQLIRVKCNKKAFLWTYERNGYINLNVKVDPEWRDFWRKAYNLNSRHFISMSEQLHPSSRRDHAAFR